MVQELLSIDTGDAIAHSLGFDKDTKIRIYDKIENAAYRTSFRIHQILLQYLK